MSMVKRCHSSMIEIVGKAVVEHVDIFVERFRSLMEELGYGSMSILVFDAMEGFVRSSKVEHVQVVGNVQA